MNFDSHVGLCVLKFSRSGVGIVANLTIFFVIAALAIALSIFNSKCWRIVKFHMRFHRSEHITQKADKANHRHTSNDVHDFDCENNLYGISNYEERGITRVLREKEEARGLFCRTLLGVSLLTTLFLTMFLPVLAQLLLQVLASVLDLPNTIILDRIVLILSCVASCWGILVYACLTRSCSLVTILKELSIMNCG